MDLYTKVSEALCEIPDEEYEDRCRYITYINEKMIFIPTDRLRFIYLFVFRCDAEIGATHPRKKSKAANKESKEKKE